MQTITGQSISSEIAIGIIRLYQHKKNIIQAAVSDDTETELARYQTAYQTALEQLQRLYEKTKAQLGETEAEIFDMHRMLLSDRQFHQAILKAITERHETAEYAVYSVSEKLWERFQNMEDSYLQARGADIQDIANRLLYALAGKEERSFDTSDPFILMAEDLSPSETVQLCSDRLVGFITRQGSPYSHTAILAKTMNVPALLRVPIQESWNGHFAIIDGEKQCVYLDPPPELVDTYRRLLEEHRRMRLQLQSLKGLPAITASGKSIRLFANVNSPSDVSAAISQDAEGIGLFRSEFLYLNAQEYPDEELQYHIYRNVLEQMQGRPVTIRTLDLGADKKSPYLALEPEENPALGYRAIRICLTQPEIFRVQLRALLRASSHGELHILFPMITSVWEIQQIKSLLDECRKELAARSVPFGKPILGIMIETPAAVMIAPELAQEVSFFSIGTNDLAQYTLALDRNNSRLLPFYDAHHPALLRMLHMVMQAAQEAKLPVCICGEAGADFSLTPYFLKEGVCALSVTPSAILPLRKHIRELSVP